MPRLNAEFAELAEKCCPAAVAVSRLRSAFRFMSSGAARRSGVSDAKAAAFP
jgi:hypothetical protein